MLADKENTEQIDNLIAQSLRALATPKMTSDEVKRQFSKDIQNANIAIMRLRQTKNDNAAWCACLIGTQKNSKQVFAAAHGSVFVAQIYSEKLRQA